jgi:hypothetical protein
MAQAQELILVEAVGQDYLPPLQGLMYFMRAAVQGLFILLLLTMAYLWAVVVVVAMVVTTVAVLMSLPLAELLIQVVAVVEVTHLLMVAMAALES